MAKHVARIDLSDGARDFRGVALEPGLPMLDKSNSTYRVLQRWLGRFVAEPEWEGDSVNFFVRDEHGGQRKDVSCRPATANRLRGELKSELDHLQDKINNVKPGSQTEQAIHGILSENFRSLTADPNRAQPGCHFFEYRDARGKARLVWCLGYQRTGDQTAAATVCGNRNCGLLFMRPRGQGARCPACGHVPVAQRVGWKKVAALLLLLVLLAAAGWYWFTRPSAVLAGRVLSKVDNNRKPIADARVSFSTGGTDYAARTGKDGKFRFAGLDSGTIEVEVSAKGYLAEKREVELVSHKEAPLEVALTGDALVKVDVVFAAGPDGDPVPVSSAEVRVKGTRLKARTDNQGRCEIKGPPSGSAVIEVTADGYIKKPVEEKLKSVKPTQIRVTLAGDATLSGRVTAAAGGGTQPVARAVVAVGGTSLKAQTDKDGKYECSGIPSGLTQLKVDADGFRREEIRKQLSPGTTVLDVALTGDTVVSGRVVNSIGGAPIAGAAIRIKGDAKRSENTDAGGRFRLREMPAGPVTLELLANGFSTKTVNAVIVPLQQKSLGDIALTGEKTIRGRVVDGFTNQPVFKAEVSIDDPDYSPHLTNNSGEFQFVGLSKDSGKIIVSAKGFAPREVPWDTKNPQLLLVKLTGTDVIAGQVIGAAYRPSRPIPDATVSIAGTECGRTDAQGRFSLENVGGNPTQIEVAAAGFVAKRVPVAELSRPVALVGSASLKGKVTGDVNRQPVAGATVAVTGTDRTALTDERGEYTIAEIPAFPATVQATGSGFRSQQKSGVVLVSGPNGPVDFALTASGGLEGVVVYAGGDKVLPVSGAAVALKELNRTEQTSQDGEFSFPQIPPGDWTLQVKAPGFDDAVVKRNPIKDAGRSIPLVGNASLSGRVISGVTGKALPGAKVLIERSPLEATSDTEGKFHVKGVRSGQATLKASSTGYYTGRLQPNLVPGENDLVRDIVLKGDATLGGRVFDAKTNQPVPKAAIRIAEPALTITTDENGRYQVLEVPSGPRTLDVTADGYGAEKLAKNLVAGPNTLDVPLASETTLTVTVVDNADPQKPVAIAGAEVRLDNPPRTGRTNSNGRVVFGKVPAKPVRIAASASGYCPARVDRELPAPTALVTVPLARGHVVTGRVINALTGRPLSGAKVVLTVNGIPHTALSDAGGGYSLEGIPRGAATVDVSSEGFCTQTIQEEVSNIVKTPIRAVLNPALAAGEMRVVLTWRKYPRDLDAHLYGSPAGGATFHVSHKNRVDGSAKLDVDNKEGEGPETITISDARPGQYTYFVVDAANIGRPGNKVLGQESGGEVKVYYPVGNRTKVKTFQVDNVKADTLGPVWHVLDIKLDADKQITLSDKSKFYTELPSGNR